MDPLTQGTLGAVLAQTGADKSKIKVAAVLGAFAGLSPDIDVLFRSSEDPLLFLEFHRQFTHSLIFIPIGAFICAALSFRWTRRILTFKEAWWFCFLGFATHGLIDACTTYGTQLLWPFSDVRIAWNNMSIIDPLFTLPILALVIIASIRKKRLVAVTAVAFALTYISFGLIQRDRAAALGTLLAEERGHQPVRLEAKPGFANLLVWKLVYETDDHFYVDAAHVGFSTRVYEGDSILKLDVERDFPWLDEASIQANDIKRFNWFSNNYLAIDPDTPNKVIDIRYSILPNTIDALWAITINREKQNEQHVGYVTNRQSSPEQLDIYWRMLKGLPLE